LFQASVVHDLIVAPATVEEITEFEATTAFIITVTAALATFKAAASTEAAKEATLFFSASAAAKSTIATAAKTTTATCLDAITITVVEERKSKCSTHLFILHSLLYFVMLVFYSRTYALDVQNEARLNLV
jgi:hypothetical protein